MAAASPGAGSASGTRNGNAITPTLAVAAQCRGSKRLATGSSPSAPADSGRKAENDGNYQDGQDAKESCGSDGCGQGRAPATRARPAQTPERWELPRESQAPPGPISRRALQCQLQAMTPGRQTRQGQPDPPRGPAAIGFERQQGQDGQPRQQRRHQARCRPITGDRRTFRRAQAAQAPRSSDLESAGRREGYSP